MIISLKVIKTQNQINKDEVDFISSIRVSTIETTSIIRILLTMHRSQPLSEVTLIPRELFKSN